jgi:hypothetical protein
MNGVLAVFFPFNLGFSCYCVENNVLCKIVTLFLS